MSKFKIGDRVRAISTSGGGGVQVGDVFVVTKIDGDYVGFFNPREGLSDGWLSHHFEPTFTLETGTFYRTRSGKPTGRVTVGDTGFEAIVDGRVRIYDAAGGHVHGDAELDIVEVWAPKVGDRVRFVRDNTVSGSKYGAKGEVVTVTNLNGYDDNKVEVTSSHLSWDPSAYVADLEPLPVAAQQPVLKLEAGKFYRTRDGQKVLVDHNQYYDRTEAGGYPWKHDDGCGGYHGLTELGTSCISRSDKDLIAEWQETTNVGAQVDTLSEEYGPIVLRNVKLHLNDNAAKPKFKVGDRVKCIDNRGAPTDFKVGEFYTVTAVEGDMVRCGDAGMFDYRFELAPAPWSGYAKQTAKFKVGDRVRFSQSYSLKKIRGVEATVMGVTDWGVQIHAEQGLGLSTERPESLEFVPAKAPTAIVALIEDGKPKPADIPHVHANQAAAEREAKRLAGVHKGKQFGVYVLATTAEEPAPVYAHEWQRLAARGQKTLAIVKLNGLTGMGIKPAKDAVEYFLAA